VHHDVESELQEAMSENVLTEESIHDGNFTFKINIFGSESSVLNTQFLLIFKFLKQ